MITKTISHDPFLAQLFMEHRVIGNQFVNDENWETIIDVIENMSKRENDCDGTVSITATPYAVQFMVAKAYEMKRNAIPHPLSVLVTHDGSIHLEWHFEEIIILLELERVEDGLAHGNTMISMHKDAETTSLDWTTSADPE